MTLTPQDVQNKSFLTVRLREGYDMQEVDQFLDEVEAELQRLLGENDDLRAQLASAQDQQPADVDGARKAANAARVSDTTIQRAADSDVDAPQQALTILTHAQTAADNLVNEAHARADELITDATSRAEAMVTEATGRAESLDTETDERRGQMLGALEREATELRTQIDDLRAHEREYRSRLIAFHTEQVRRLQEPTPDDGDVEAPEAYDAPDGEGDRDDRDEG
jgi:DivIVA domain-containing protein